MNEVTVTVIRESAPFWPTILGPLVFIYLFGVAVFISISLMEWLSGNHAEARRFVWRAWRWPVAFATTLYRIATYKDDGPTR